MSGWRSVRLGQHIRVKHGFAFKGEYFSDQGRFIVLTPGNFIESGGFKPKSGTEKYYTASPPPEYVLRRGDLVIAMTEQSQGLLGSSALIPSDNTYLHNQRIGLVEQCSGETDRRFLYYLFNTSSVRNQIQATATGSKVRHTAPERVESVTVQLPDLDTQRQIAAFLSAYDDLIENNSRRIRILEEMAQRIYREWFVDFRYPGHENVSLVDSILGRIPQGWEVKPLGHVSDLRWGDTAKTKHSYVKQGYVAFSASGPDGKLATYDYDQDGIVLSAIGAHCGKTWFAKGRWSCIKNTMRLWSIDPRTSNEYLYLATRRESFWPKRGAAQPFIGQADARAMQIIAPSENVAKKFRSLAAPILDMQWVLALANTTLSGARDSLLPRLIAGEIDVSKLDIVVPVDAI